MSVYSIFHRALFKAPCLVLAGVFITQLSPAQAVAGCISSYYDETVVVDRVYDGDTLRLRDGRNVRLIGVNAPEKAHRQRAAEPYGDEAGHFLQSLLGRNDKIHLRYGQEKKDHYGRWLAHVFSLDGHNITETLLLAGMGSAVQIAPNLWDYRCYLQAEKVAREAKRGIWGHPYFLPMAAEQLSAADTGYHFVKGRLSRVGKSKKAVWLNLGQRFAIRIAKSNLHNFTEKDFSNRIGHELIVRGWIYEYKSQLRMNVSHEAAISWGMTPPLH